MSGLLLNERIVSAHPSLVRALGLTRAVVLQQLYWHLAAADHGEPLDDGEEWVPITVARLAEEIGLSEDTIGRALVSLEREDGLVVSCQPEGRASRRKWYRVDTSHALLNVPDTRNLRSSEPAESRDADTRRSAGSSSTEPSEPSKPPDADASAPKRKGSKPRRSDPRADPLTRTWWEAQDPRPAQSFVAARGVVSGALAAGWSEDELRAVLARTDPPLSGGRLDYVRSRMRGSRRAEDQPMDRDLPEGRVAL